MRHSGEQRGNARFQLLARDAFVELPEEHVGQRRVIAWGHVAEFADRRTSSQSVRNAIHEALITPER